MPAHILIIWLHFIGDFLFQTDQMALNKSKSNRWLTLHVLVYAAPLLLLGLPYALINAAAHWIVDYCTSRATSALYERSRHWFFVMIGFDQAIHLTCLLYSWSYFNGN